MNKENGCFTAYLLSFILFPNLNLERLRLGQVTYMGCYLFYVLWYWYPFFFFMAFCVKKVTYYNCSTVFSMVNQLLLYLQRSDKSQRSFIPSAFALIFSCLYSQRLKVSLTVVAWNIQKLYIWKCDAINCLVWYSFLHYFMKVWHKWSFEIPRKTAKGFLLTSSISLCLRRYWRTYFPKNNNIRTLLSLLLMGYE